MKTRKLLSSVIAAILSVSALPLPSSVQAESRYEIYQSHCADTTEDGFGYSYFEDGVAINSYTGSAEDVVIPDQIDGKPVKRIGKWAFAGTTGMKTVHFPDSLTSIGPDAFCSCTGLTTITLPESLRVLSAYSFVLCTSLETVYIGNNLICLPYPPPFNNCLSDDSRSMTIHLACGSRLSTQPTDYYWDWDLGEPYKNYRIVKDDHDYIEDPQTGIKTCSKCGDQIGDSINTVPMNMSLKDDNGKVTLIYGTLNKIDSNSYALFRFTDGTVKKVFGQPYGNSGLKFELDLEYTQLNEVVEGQVFYPDGTKGKKHTLSVPDYLTLIWDDTNDDSVSELARAIKNMGAYSDIYSGDLTNAPIDDFTDVEATILRITDDGYMVKEPISDEYNTVITGDKIKGIYAASAYLSVGTHVSLNAKFKAIDGIAGCTFRVDGEKVMPTETEDGYWLVKIPNIGPSDYGTIYHFTITKDDKTYELDYSPMTYFKNKLASDDAGTELKNLCKAMVKYYCAALSSYYYSYY